MDTWAPGALFEADLGGRRDRMWRVPVGAEDLFAPAPDRAASRRPYFEVLWWGTFIPFHGVDVVIDAALRLETERRIRFTILGDGPTRAAAQRRAAEHQLSPARRELAARDLIDRHV